MLLFVGGLLLFGALAVVSRRFESQSETRLLTQQTEEAGLVLTLAVDQYRAPLAAAARSAGVTDGDLDVFIALMSPMVGEDEQMFRRAALFRVGDPEPVAQVGADPLLLDEASIERLVGAPPEPLRIVDLLDAGRALGYAAHDDTAADWLVYGERQLSAEPTVRRRNDEPFRDLNYSIYLGTEESPETLLGASTADLPLRGRRAVVDLDFGDQNLRLVSTARTELGGSEGQALWWVVLVGGVVASAGVAWLLERVLAGRRRAQELAGVTETLLADQRHHAEQLQISLLPALTTAPRGVEIAGRYWPAGTVHLIGGDFYDLFQIDDRRWGLLIGDVCGKGMEAAGLTGLARYTVQGAARYTASPSEMLRTIHTALAQRETTTFATACLIVLDVDPSGGARALVSLGGHPAPLVRRIDGTVTEIGQPGSILGWFEPDLHDVEVDLAVGDVLVLYTDGLTDAPGDQAVPLAEVTDLLAERGGSAQVGQLADEIRVLKRRRRPHGSTDDTALLCVRFVSPIRPGQIDVAPPASDLDRGEVEADAADATPR